MELKLGKNKSNGHNPDEGLTKEVKAQGRVLQAIVQHLQNQTQVQSTPVLTQKERRDLLQTLTDPPDDILPQLTDVQPLMATMIPAMDVIKWGYTPESEWPINPRTGRAYGAYDLWQLSYARWNLSKAAHNAIRLADVVQTRGESPGRGIVAE